MNRDDCIMLILAILLAISVVFNIEGFVQIGENNILKLVCLSGGEVRVNANK